MDNNLVTWLENKKQEKGIMQNDRIVQRLKRELSFNLPQNANDLELIFSCLQEWKIQEIHMKKMQSILKSINHILLPSLKRIYVEENNIQSIEALSHISLPFLTHLYLMNNFIGNISIFKKLYYPSLFVFSLQNNQIIETKQLENIFDTQRNSQVIIGFQVFKNQRLQGNQITWIAKVNTSRIFIWVQNNKRIKQTRLVSALTKKFQSLKLIY